MKSIHNNPFYRKGKSLLNKAPRYLAFHLSSDSDYIDNPPIICNSFPKSGTHLLKQVLSALPNTKSYDAFIATQPTYGLHKRNIHSLEKKLLAVTPGELICSHLEYNHALDEMIKSRNIIHYFIYRDLRAIAVSEAYYLTYMNKWHRLHQYYKKLPDMDSRISLCIKGGRKADGLPYDYPDIGSRFREYFSWIKTDGCMAVKFEDLIGKGQLATVESIIDHYLMISNIEADRDKLVKDAIEAINPSKSHTFREGTLGGWKKQLSDKHLQEMNNFAGNELEKLGYSAV